MSTPVTSAPQAQSGTRRYPLDALRAIAAVGVLGFHTYQNNKVAGSESYSWTGFAHELMLSTDALVALFLVISGFVLWLPVATSLLANRPQRSAKMMLLRRAARLVPLYLVVILVVWVINNPGPPGHWEDLILHVTFTQVYSDQYIFWTVGPAWSLAVEFHFYLLVALSIPLVGRIAAGAGRRGQVAALLALPAAMIVAGVLWLTWAIHVSPQPGDAWSVWFNPLAKAPLFACGLVLAVLVAAGARVRRRFGRVALILSSAAILLAGTVFREEMPGNTDKWIDLTFGVAACAFVAAIVLNDGPAMRWLTWSPLVRVGALSYGIYLVHEPIMRLVRSTGVLPDPGSPGGVLATFAVVLTLAILIAKLTSATIERYGMKLLDVYRSDGRPRNYYAHDISDPLSRPLTASS